MLLRDPRPTFVVVNPQPEIRLSKSRFVAGWQCPKLLWWTVHEPQAEELQPDIVLQDLFDQGRLVGERARKEWPDGTLVPGIGRDSSRITRTREALAADRRVIFEASFEHNGVFAALDVLERSATGWNLVEVKSSAQVKDYHLPDVAFQAYMARNAGLAVARMEVMHLNTEFRHPDAGTLFTRSDVTEQVEPLLPEVPTRIAEQVAMLQGPLPEHAVGGHCWFRGGDCAFHRRCWPDDPDHISNLWNVGPKTTIAWMAQGVNRMSDIPPGTRLNDKQKRQIRSQQEHRLIVEPGLGAALKEAADATRLGFLDFETVGRAIPPWNGLGPWRQTAAQFSYHERDSTGSVTHAEFLAEGPPDPSLSPDDPREPLARAMLEATAKADRIVMYTPFESTRIKELAEHLPHLAEPLNQLRAKLWDLCPVIANNVYHPDFRGSFSLKEVLAPLTGLSYNDLVIVDGMVASVEIARLLFVSGRIPPAERDRIRKDLLDYCERDTYGTVVLVERLIEMAADQATDHTDR